MKKRFLNYFQKSNKNYFYKFYNCKIERKKIIKGKKIFNSSLI